MPRNTFFNLNANKRKEIIDAAIIEFSNLTIDKATVKGIIANANISRGSFYKYFDDIDDLFYYTIQIVEEQLYVRIIENLKKYDGDLFVSVRLAFNNEIERVKKFKSFFTNIYLASNNPDNEINKLKNATIERGIRNISKYVNPVDFRSIDVSILIAMMLNRIHELSRLAIINDEDSDILVKQFVESLKILKFGASKGI